MAKDCRYMRIKFAGYADGDLRAEERKQVDHHVAHCAACAKELADVIHFLNTCNEFIVCPGPMYSFEQLRLRMATIEPLEELVAFLPKLRINASIPRFAVAMVFLFLAGGTPFTLRSTKVIYSAMRVPFASRVAQMEDDYQDRLDVEYRQQVIERSHTNGRTSV